MASKHSPLVWVDCQTVARIGWWFHRENANHEEDIVRIYREEGETELSVRYGSRPNDVVWLQNWRDHQFAGPIPVPEDPPLLPPEPDIYTDGVRMVKGRRRAAR